MMLNELILARGYILAPMLPTAGGMPRAAAKPKKGLGAAIVDAFKRCFGKAAR